MQSTLAQSWWLLLLRGIIAIVFGVLALAWPQVTLVTLVLFYGAYALADGIIALAVAVTREIPSGLRGRSGRPRERDRDIGPDGDTRRRP